MLICKADSQRHGDRRVQNLVIQACVNVPGCLGNVDPSNLPKKRPSFAESSRAESLKKQFPTNCNLIFPDQRSKLGHRQNLYHSRMHDSLSGDNLAVRCMGDLSITCKSFHAVRAWGLCRRPRPAIRCCPNYWFFALSDTTTMPIKSSQYWACQRHWRYWRVLGEALLRLLDMEFTHPIHFGTAIISTILKSSLNSRWDCYDSKHGHILGSRHRFQTKKQTMARRTWCLLFTFCNESKCLHGLLLLYQSIAQLDLTCAHFDYPSHLRCEDGKILQKIFIQGVVACYYYHSVFDLGFTSYQLRMEGICAAWRTVKTALTR